MDKHNRCDRLFCMVFRTKSVQRPSRTFSCSGGFLPTIPHSKLKEYFSDAWLYWKNPSSDKWELWDEAEDYEDNDVDNTCSYCAGNGVCRVTQYKSNVCPKCFGTGIAHRFGESIATSAAQDVKLNNFQPCTVTCPMCQINGRVGWLDEGVKCLCEAGNLKIGDQCACGGVGNENEHRSDLPPTIGKNEHDSNISCDRTFFLRFENDTLWMRVPFGCHRGFLPVITVENASLAWIVPSTKKIEPLTWKSDLGVSL